jgi:hypothetical protein
MGKKDKTPGKAPAKGDGDDGDAADAVPYATRVKFCSTIAKPLADEKLCKKVRMGGALATSAWSGPSPRARGSSCRSALRACTRGRSRRSSTPAVVPRGAPSRRRAATEACLPRLPNSCPGLSAAGACHPPAGACPSPCCLLSSAPGARHRRRC